MTDNIENQTVRRGVQSPVPPSLCGLVAVLFLCLTFFPAFTLAKPFEQTGTFGGLLKAGEVSEEAQLNGVSGLAVNYTGAGGVPKGTVYAVTNGNGDIRVARFTPEKGGVKFVERWEIINPVAEKQREEQGDAPYSIDSLEVFKRVFPQPHGRAFRRGSASSTG